MNILLAGSYDLLHTGHINLFKKLKENNRIILLIHSDRFVSTYKRVPIINEDNRLEMIKSLEIVDEAFICDKDYITEEILDKYNINKVYYASDKGLKCWSYYFHNPIKRNIMNYIKYDNSKYSTTKIISKILENKKENDYKDRYTKENILKSEELYGKNYQSPCKEEILEDILNKGSKYNNILEIGSGLGGNSIYLEKKYKCNITGLDICKNMIDICKERLKDNKISYINIDYIDYETNNKFDLILCRDVLLYMYTEKKYDFLNKVKSDLSNNGTFILIDYCKGDIDSNEYKEYCMKRKWNVIDIPFYKKLLTDCGFKIIKDGNISNKYINYTKNIIDTNSKIDKDVKINLDKKIKYLENRWFEWHYFILM
jgi:FAD synthetase